MYATKPQGKALSLGYLMIGLAGTVLSDRERQQLLHLAVAGVVLFSRNFESPEQLRVLTESIHGLRHPRLLVAVDHEGGRVQRFKTQGFTHLPAMSALGVLFDDHPHHALSLAQDIGWLLASELLACGVDFSFAPVLDLDYGNSSVIGDRALHHNPHVVGALAEHIMKGMTLAGMASVGKHFPGHGHVVPDTHIAIAVDDRPLAALIGADMQPFKTLISHHLAAIMAAHVIYPQVDPLPAGLSRVWLQDLLRERCGFAGAIISDDLGMAAVSQLSDGAALSEQFRKAGCDLVLLCNNQTQIEQALSGLKHYDADPVQESRLIRLHGKPQQHYSGLAGLQATTTWLNVMKQLAKLG
jgi:beta-N-acetylhexosaminidase